MTTWLSTIPFYLFVFVFFVIFALFLWGIFLIILSGRKEELLRKGRRIILTSLYCLFAALLISFVFFLVSYLLERGEVLKPPVATGEFPPVANFPPPPEFITLGKYHFIGPALMEEHNDVRGPAIYPILCKKNEEYDIIDIVIVKERGKFLEHKEYKCWVENCNQNSQNLYVAVLMLSPDKYSSIEIEKIIMNLLEQFNPRCSSFEI